MIDKWNRQTIVHLLALLVLVSIGIVCVPYVQAALLNYIYPPDRDIQVNRAFQPHDFSTLTSGDIITVTIEVTNTENVALRGFYYSDQLPNGWPIHTTEVSINGSPAAGYTYHCGAADEIYTGATPHRWAMETPVGGGVFSPTQPIPASGGTARIVYTLTVLGAGSDYVLGRDGWAGWLETEPVGTAAFGYQTVPTPPIPLQADFTAAPRSGAAPLTVTFTDTSTGGPTGWAWDFGDDSIVSSQQHPTHTYATPVVYTVTLTITRTEPPDSDTVVKSHFITVTLPPLEARFTAWPRMGLAPLVVQFTDLSIGNILTREWNFGDSGTSLLPGTVTPPGPTHTYRMAGSYTVSLTVYDADRSHTLSQSGYIRVTDMLYTVYLPTILRNNTP
jgi:uncharacterized repeat protein (TIGR01451 family)